MGDAQEPGIKVQMAIYTAALTALFETHPNKAALLKVFQARSDYFQEQFLRMSLDDAAIEAGRQLQKALLTSAQQSDDQSP